MAYDNTNRWTLNKNERKQQDSHADYQGKINVEGKEYWLNGWIKDGPKGKFISGTIKAIGEQMVSTGKHSYSPGGKVRREDPISTGRPSNMAARSGVADKAVGNFRDDMSDEIPF